MFKVKKVINTRGRCLGNKLSVVFFQFSIVRSIYLPPTNSLQKFLVQVFAPKSEVSITFALTPSSTYTRSTSARLVIPPTLRYTDTLLPSVSHLYGSDCNPILSRSLHSDLPVSESLPPKFSHGTTHACIGSCTIFRWVILAIFNSVSVLSFKTLSLGNCDLLYIYCVYTYQFVVSKVFRCHAIIFPFFSCLVKVRTFIWKINFFQ